VRFDARSPPRHNAQDIEREVRRMADEEKKLLLAHRDKLRVADRDGSCAAWSGIDQRHLTEDGIVGQSFEHAIAEADLDLAVLNDEQLIGIVALAEDDIARLKFAHRHACASQYPKIDRRIRHKQGPS
jgi:hypothetical protein